jgi:hypothetical protein
MNFQDMFSKPKLIRYGIVLVVIFILLQSVPNRSLGIRDAVVVSIVLFALYVVIENVFTKAAICGEKESMTNFRNNFSSDVPVISTYVPTQVTQPVQPTQPVQAMPIVQSVPEVNKPGECKDCVKKSVDEYGMDTYVYKTNTQKYETGPTRASAGVMPTETQYTDYNILPVTPEDSKLYEYGYSFLPPEKWYPVPPHPPVCVSEKKCPVCPVTTTGTPVDMKEWNDSRRITPGDVINIDYARDKLNSGR